MFVLMVKTQLENLGGWRSMAGMPWVFDVKQSDGDDVRNKVPLSLVRKECDLNGLCGKVEVFLDNEEDMEGSKGGVAK